MPHPSRVGPSERFCSFCGYPPGSGWPERPDHRCGLCDIGAIVRAPARLAPHPGDPFLIVDDRLVVRAISCSTESLGQGVELIELIELAAAGRRPIGDIVLSTVRPPEISVRGRLTSCVDPAAAVLGLAPSRYALSSSSVVRPAASAAGRGA